MKYSPIFTIELQHDYFAETTPQVLRIVPTGETEGLLKDAGLLAKFFKNKLYVLAKHIEGDIPLKNLRSEFKLQFFIEVVDVDFHLITNYEQEDPYNKKLHFSNADSIIDQNSKSVEGLLYLNEKLTEFDSSKAYKYNMLVRSGSNNAYECLKKINAGTGNLNNGSQFRKLGKISYVSGSSALLFSGPEKEISIETPAPTVTIKYFSLNTANGLFDQLEKESNIGQDENPSADNIERAVLNFYDSRGKTFPEGIYRIKINSQELFIYFRPENDWQSYLGIINIYHQEGLSADYRFLNTDGSFITVPPSNKEIKTTNYIIRFAPSQYLLQYKCRTAKVLDIIDDDGDIEFINKGSNIFQSELPVRMSEMPIETISIKYDGADEIKKIKNPGYRNLILKGDENDYLVSEIYLNL